MRMHRLEEIPTVPNSPAEFAAQLKSPSPALSGTEWSELDMMSSIESLARHSTRPPSSMLHERSPQLAYAARQDSVPLPPRPEGGEGGESGGVAESTDFADASVSSHSHYDFVMPSLPRISTSVDEPVIGLVHVAVAGANGAAVVDALAAHMFDRRREVRDDGVEALICSSSAHEQGNVIVDDANFVPNELSRWLEIQLQREAPVDLVVYSLAAEGPTKEDFRAMAEIQGLCELAVVTAEAGPRDQIENTLRCRGVSGFMRRVWFMSASLEHNWDMTASAVEGSGYRSFVVPESSELATLVKAVKEHSGRIRASSRATQSKWFQSQLVVTHCESAGALAHRVNLRRKALESIANLDPLGIAHWSSVPRLTTALFAGLISGTLAALGFSAFCTRLVSSSPMQTTSKRHTSFDMENWPQWLT